MSETRNRIDDEDMDTQGGYYLSGLFNIETSPGFKALESVKGRKDVNEEQITRYRTEFIKLHGFLLNLHNHQKGMVEHLRLTLQEITLAKLDQDRAISQQFSGNAEIGELKRELVKAQNEVDMALDLEAKLQLDMEDLLKTKQDLVHDIEEIRRHKADMLEPQLIAATKELKMELVQRRHQIENLQKDLEEKQVVLNGVMLERDRAEAEKEKHSIALAKASETPIKILKQIEVLQDAINALQGEHTKQMTIGSSLDKEIERLGKKKKDLEEHRLNQSAAYEERRGLISQMERQVDDIFKEHEVAKEQLSFQKAERVRLDLGLRKVLHEIKREHDLVLRVIREKDTYLKYFRRLELTVNNIKMSTPSTIKQGEELQRQLKGIKADEGFYRKEIVRLRQAIDISTLEFLKQDKLEKSEVEALEEHRQLNQKLEQELEVALKEAAESAKAAEELKIEKDLKLRDVIRAGSKMRSVKNDNITQDIAVVDAYKRCQETTQRVKEFLTLYELLNQIHSSTQRVAEMKEKIKILTNEIEILRHEISTKDRELARKKQENSAAYALRDSLRNEANRLMHQYRDKRDQIDHRLSRIETLNANINNAEEQMLKLKERYEQSVKDRNQSGVNLLDRNDELCILYERINVQKEVMAKGASALNDREDEIQRLELILKGLERKYELEKQKKPVLMAKHKEIVELEKDRNLYEKRMIQLSKQMENPKDPKRCRNLGGQDPDPEQLSKRIEKLETLLAAQEVDYINQETILEKDLVLEEVSQLAERLKSQTAETKDETSMYTMEINDVTKRIKNVTRKTMAKVSELAMNQANAMSLYREKSEKECLLKESIEKLESGEIPIEQIEADFIHAEKQRQRRQAKMEQMQKDNNSRLVELYYLLTSDDAFYMNGGVRTMAEPRPNAYIPEASAVGQLPIPKPYGQHAPFKPQEPGSQLRHYRKPVIKPIEI